MNNKTNIRNLIFGIIVGLIVVFNVFEWTNFIIKYSKQNSKVSKVKNLKNKTNKHNNNNTENDIEYEVKSGYKYKKSNGESSTFALRNLGYAESLMNNQVSYDNLKGEYCTVVNEITKVDNGIMPGTTKPFEEVTYTQVDDAYREHLQKIAQIRQVFDTIYGNDNDLENGAGCHYTGTHWNNANSQYKAKQFYDSSIIKYLNNHGYGIKNENNTEIGSLYTMFGTNPSCVKLGEAIVTRLQNIKNKKAGYNDDAINQMYYAITEMTSIKSNDNTYLREYLTYYCQIPKNSEIDSLGISSSKFIEYINTVNIQHIIEQLK